MLEIDNCKVQIRRINTTISLNDLKVQLAQRIYDIRYYNMKSVHNLYNF